MEELFAGIPLGEVTTSMTINAPAAILLAFYVLVGESQGVPPEKLGGTIQTDILKEYIAQKEWCFPIDPALRLVTDMIEWCTEHMPRWHPVSISGYHIREAGSTAQQELAFTLKDGFTYVEGRSSGAWTSTPSPRGSPSSSTPTSTSSRRSPSTGPRGGSGPGSCKETYGAIARGVDAAALPHPDRRRLADRPAASQQHRPHLAGGDGCRTGRHPVPAHQLLRRGARAADRGGGAGRPAHPADHRQ